MLPPTDLDSLSHADLKSLVLKLLEEAAELRRTVAAQRDEIARLKGGPGRPNIKPSGMDKATEPRPPPPTGSEPRQKGGKTSKLSIHEERTVTVAAPPQGSRFKGYTNFVVQDLVIRSHVVNFRRERWQKPDGDMMTAPLPAGISGHFGPELRRFVLAQYHQGQMTVPRLLAQLRAFGIVISKRQLVRLLIAGQDGFLAENREVLRAGLSSAAWVTVDDTGARHKAANGFCTQIGNAHFVWFGTTASKSRLNFLHLLRAGHSDYVINTEALDYMRQRALSSPVIARLAEHPQRFFTSQVAWTAHLDRLGISALEVNPDPVMVATEGALWGSVKSHGFLPDTVIVSDDAGQFNVGPHGLCWVHAERLVHKLDTFTDEQRRQQRLQIEARRLLEAGERRVPRPHQMPVRRDIEAAGYMHDDAGRLPKRLGQTVIVKIEPIGSEAHLDIIRREVERLHHGALSCGGIGTRKPRARQHRRDGAGVVLAPGGAPIFVFPMSAQICSCPRCRIQDRTMRQAIPTPTSR